MDKSDEYRYLMLKFIFKYVNNRTPRIVGEALDSWNEEIELPYMEKEKKLKEELNA